MELRFSLVNSVEVDDPAAFAARLAYFTDFASRASRLGDDGTNDLVVSQVLRGNELQTWFLSEHLVNMPLVEADGRPHKSA